MSITYSAEVEQMCCVAQGPNHGPAPLPEEGKWIQAKQISDISGFTHGVGWCAPQQLSLIHISIPRCGALFRSAQELSRRESLCPEIRSSATERFLLL